MSTNRTSQAVEEKLATCRRGNYSGILVEAAVLEKYQTMEEALKELKIRSTVRGKVNPNLFGIDLTKQLEAYYFDPLA